MALGMALLRKQAAMRAANILNLGVKELRSLQHDVMMIVLIVYSFTISIYTAATALPEVLHKAPIAIVDEDRSQLSTRISDAFFPPYFTLPTFITRDEIDRRMDIGLDTFAIDLRNSSKTSWREEALTFSLTSMQPE